MEAVDFAGLIFKNMDVGASGFPAQIIDKAWKRVVVEFMVSGDIENMRLKPLFQDPPQAQVTQMNVAGQDDYIGPDFRDAEFAEFNMQI
jgi:hypothetical protein